MLRLSSDLPRCLCTATWRRPRRRIERASRTACRSPRNWRGVRSDCGSSPRHVRRSTRGRKNALRASRPTTKPSWRRGTPRPRPQARSLQGGRPSRRSRHPCPPTDQINLTDEASRIMPVAGGGFEQCYNAQAVVAAGSLLVVAADVVQAANDKQQLAPMLGKIDTLPAELGRPETLLADSGYFSAANVTVCQAAEIEPLIAAGRQHHHPSLHERFAAAGPAPDHPTLGEAMAHRLQTPEGKKLYALRKQTPEPVLGIIKSVLGFRQFLLRGLDAVRGEWSLVTLAWNMKRMFALSLAG